MGNKDFYKILGVGESADAGTIKKAYRKQAKANHPDSNLGDRRAEQRFKDISQAYSVLSDAAKRQQYDHLRKYGFDPRQRGTAGPTGSPGGLGFDLSDLFRGARAKGGRRRPAKDFDLDDFFGFGGLGDIFGFAEGSNRRNGRAKSPGDAHIRASIQIPFRTAALGGKAVFNVGENGGKRYALKISPGTQDGKTVRLSGEGHRGQDGKRSGDLIVSIKVARHRFFRLKGLHIYCEVPITHDQSLSGAQIKVKTIHGKTVQLKIPANTESGKIFRLKDLGVKKNNSQGDQYVTIKVG